MDDVEVITKIREFVYNGGGFIGVGGQQFLSKNMFNSNLSDVLGVDQEVGYSCFDKYPVLNNQHFILEGIDELNFWRRH